MGLILIIFGLFLNLLVCLICLKSKRLRVTSTFKILAIAAINDSILCFTWNFDDFTNTFFDFRPYRRNLFYCQVMVNFLAFVTITYASWLLVTLSLDRVMSLYIRTWNKHYFKGLRTLYFSIVLLILIIGINAVTIFRTGHSYVNANGTEINVCFTESNGSSEIFDIMSKVKFYFQSGLKKNFIIFCP